MKRTLLPILVALPALVLVAPASAERPPPEEPSAHLTRAIDAALEDAWKARAIEPAPRADDLTIYRRLSLDLHGTIPSLEELRAFESEPAEHRIDRTIARLFADARFNDAFAERLARVVVGAGRKDDDLFYRRRRFVAWLAKELKARRPWNAIVRELLQSEGVSVDGPSNFVVAADGDPVKLAGRTARAFLGVRLDCAQCHDHPFADWKQADFEGLAAFFARTKRDGPFVHEKDSGEYELDDRKSGKPRVVKPGVPFLKTVLVLPEQVPSFCRPNRRESLARWITDPRNGWFARSIANRLWAWLMGRGLVEPVDELDTSKPSHPDVLDLIARDLVENGFDLERVVRAIVSTRAYALASSLPAERATDDADGLLAAHALFPLKALHADQLAHAIYQATSFVVQDERRPLLVRLDRFGKTNDFVARHGGDLDAESPEDPTLLRRLLLLNGFLIDERLRDDQSAVARLVLLAPTHERIVETAFLMVLTRRPSPEEREHFLARLAHRAPDGMRRSTEDLFWALINSVEFSWNH